MWIGHVAGGKDARHTCARRAFLGQDVARRIRLDPRLEDVRVRLVTDGEEEAIDGDVHLLLIGFAFSLHKMRTLHTAFAKEPDGVVLKQHGDVRRVHHTLLHHLRGAEVGLADDEVDVCREAG